MQFRTLAKARLSGWCSVINNHNTVVSFKLDKFQASTIYFKR